MAAAVGRDVDFTWNAAPILGVREKSAAMNGEAINITSDEDNGWQTLLQNTAAENSVEISLSGVSKDTVLKAAWFSGARTANVSLTYPNGDILSGSFFLVNFDEGIAYNDAVTFECTLQSNGTVTYTPYS